MMYRIDIANGRSIGVQLCWPRDGGWIESREIRVWSWIIDGAAGRPGYLNRLLGETSIYDPLLLQWYTIWTAESWRFPGRRMPVAAAAAAALVVVAAAAAAAAAAPAADCCPCCCLFARPNSCSYWWCYTAADDVAAEVKSRYNDVTMTTTMKTMMMMMMMTTTTMTTTISITMMMSLRLVDIPSGK